MDSPNDVTTDVVSCTFKKRKKKKKRRRDGSSSSSHNNSSSTHFEGEEDTVKRTTTTTTENEEVEKELSVEERIALVREEHRNRKKMRGVSTSKLLERKKKRIMSIAQEEKAMDVSRTDNKKHIDGLLSGAFSKQSNREALVTNNLMEAYVKKRMGLSKNDDPETMDPHRKTSSSTHSDDVDDIYRAAEKLLVGRDSGSSGGAAEEHSSAGGPIVFGTGIAEIVLPVEFKLKNIEETEKLKRHAMIGRARLPAHVADNASGHGIVAVTLGNHSSNFRRHNRVRRQERVDASIKNRDASSSSGPRKKIRDVSSSGGPQPKWTNDDRAVSRFRKRERESFRRRG